MKTVTVTHLLQVLRGSTAPALAQGDDGGQWVVKFAGAGPGARGLLVEILATSIARTFGAPAPEAMPIRVAPDMPWEIGSDEFDAVLQRSAGWNLGLRFVPGTRHATLADVEAADPAVLARIAAADRFLQNVDRTARNPNLLIDATGALHAIDHDACLFLDRALAQRMPFRFDLPQGHILSGRTLPEVAIAPFDVSALATAPDDWIAITGLSREEIAERLSAYAAAFFQAR